MLHGQHESDCAHSDEKLDTVASYLRAAKEYVTDLDIRYELERHLDGNDIIV